MSLYDAVIFIDRPLPGSVFRDITPPDEPNILPARSNCKKCGRSMQDKDGTPVYRIRYELCDTCLKMPPDIKTKTS
jgi:hypothetical protein